MTRRLRPWSLAVAFALIPLAACEFTHTMNLPSNTGLAENNSVGRGRAVAVHVPFKDERAVRDHCGKVANWRIECDQEPAAWLAGLLVQELSDRGFAVASDQSPPSPGILSIDGALRRLYVRRETRGLAITTVAEIAVKLTARSDSGFEQKQSFVAQGDSGLEYWRLSHRDYHVSTFNALKSIIRDMAKAIDDWERNKDR